MKKSLNMKYVKIFEHFINENLSKETLKKTLPGVKFLSWGTVDDEDEYNSVSSFSTKVRDLDDDLYLNIYDDNSFCFFYDSSPISTSAHSKSDADKMARTQIEVPLPLNKLTKGLFDEVVNSIKALNEGIAFGSKAKAFAKKIEDEMETFDDAMKADEALPKEWHDALKKLNIKSTDAAICYFDAVGSKQEVLDAAKSAGLKYLEVEDSEGGSDGIIFSNKQ
jgi:hypothetical protein